MEQKVLTRRSLPLLLFSLLCTAAVYAQPRFSANQPTEKLLPKLVASMSDSELLGQVFLLGYGGSLPTPRVMDWIEKHGLGGVIIFGWNATNLTDVVHSVSEMQRAAAKTRFGIPLVIATDQEGGWVRHIQGDTSVTPGNMAIGATDIPEDAYKTARYIGKELRALGINLNLAPDVDVLTNVHANVIGPRSFSSNPVKTALLSVAYYRGMAADGLISAAKHYPGHGDASKDSHLTLPVIPASLPTIWKRDLLPFRFLIKEGIPAILVGHLAYPKITGSVIPATLSPYFDTEILRKRLGFKGVLITDDLLMGGVQDTGLSMTQICAGALEAGDDMLMISQTPALDSTLWNNLLARMHSDPRFAATVRTAATRVLRMKLEYLKGPHAVPRYPTIAGMKRELPDHKGEAFFFQQACRAVTLVKKGDLPLLDPKGKKILLVGQFKDFLVQGKRRYRNAATYLLPYVHFYFPQPGAAQRLLKVAAHYPIIVFCVANPNSMQVLEALRPLEKRGTRIIAVSTLSPLYLRKEPWVSSAIAVYGYGKQSFAAGFAVLKGDFKAEGKLPIDLLNGVF